MRELLRKGERAGPVEMLLGRRVDVEVPMDIATEKESAISDSGEVD